MCQSDFTGTIFIKLKKKTSCEIEDFVETHLCKLCVIHTSIARTVVHVLYGLVMQGTQPAYGDDNT